MPTGLNSVRYTLEAVDKVTAVYRNIIKLANEVGKRHDVVNVIMRKSQAVMRTLGNVVNGVERKISGLAMKTKEGISKVVNSLGGLGTALAGIFTINTIRSAFMSMTQSASMLNGAMALSKDTFEQYFGVISTLADQASDSLGMSRSEVYKTANSFGTLFKSMGYGSEKVAALSVASVRLVQDLASARGMTNEDALNAYRDAIQGNAEAALRLGVILDDGALKQRAYEMGLIKSTKVAMPDFVRSQAAMAEVISQTSAIQGHFIKNKDNDFNATKRLAAAEENLRAKLGDGLLPVKVKLLEVMNNMVHWVSENTHRMQSWGGVALRVAGALVGVYGTAKLLLGIKGFITTVRMAMDLFRNSTILTEMAMKALAFASKLTPFGWISIAIGAIVMLSDKFEGLRAKLLTLFEPVKRVFLKAFNWIYDNILKPMFGWLGKWFDFDLSKPKTDKTEDDLLTSEGYFDKNQLVGGSKAKDLGVGKRNEALVSGAGKDVKHINIRIDKLVEQFNITTNTMAMSMGQIKSEIERVLLSAVNEVNYQ